MADRGDVTGEMQVARIEPATLGNVQYRKKQISLENYVVPYVTEQEQNTHREVLGKAVDWLVQNDIAQVDELAKMLEAQLPHSHWDLLEDKQDYWLIVLSKGLKGEEQQLKLRNALARSGAYNLGERYKNQLVWEGTALQIYIWDHQGKIPDSKDRSMISDKIGQEFGAYDILRTCALERPVKYSPDKREDMFRFCRQLREIIPVN